jgi:hypothetical protein
MLTLASTAQLPIVLWNTVTRMSLPAAAAMHDWRLVQLKRYCIFKTFFA